MLLPEPAIVAGAAAANKSSSSELPFQLSWHAAPPSEFFAGGEETMERGAQQITIRDGCLRPFELANSTESDINSAVFVELQHHRLQFPGENNKEGDIIKTYSKCQLRTLFTECGESFSETVVVQSEEQGLIVTLASMPDMCVFRDNKQEITLGELKHNEKYSREATMNQALCYMYCVLYFYRVKLGLPVNTVYGFTVCGHKCKGLESTEYAVDLLKLTAPQRLAGNFLGKRCGWKFNTNDRTGFQRLVYFLKKGNVADVATALVDKREEKKRSPSLFGIPHSLWNDRDDESRTIVRGGTCAMVFRVSLGGLVELLQEGPKSILFKRYLDAVQKWKDSPGKRESSDKSSFFYVKVRTREVSAHFRTTFQTAYQTLRDIKDESAGQSETSLSEALQDFFETYVMSPFERNDFCLCIMADRGVCCDLKNFSRQKLCALLLQFKEELMAMAKFFVHGDVLPHNLVYNEPSESLHLIDYDEGVMEGVCVPLRKLNFDKSRPHWYTALMYPNALRAFGQDYTRVQFVATVIAVLPDNDPEKEQVAEFMSIAERLGSLLIEHNDEGGPMLPEVADLIQQLDDAVTEFLKQPDAAVS